MEISGTLGKRRRRNIAKVNGLKLASNGTEEFKNKINGNPTSSFRTRRSFTSLNLSSSDFGEYRKQSCRVPSSRTRPTRNPMFHTNKEKNNDVENGLSETKSASQDQKQNKFIQTTKPDGHNNRSHFFGKATMMRLKHILYLGLTSGTFPWKWNGSNHKIETLSPFFIKLWKIFRFLFTIQTLCITVFQGRVFWQLASSKNVTNREIFMASFNLMWYVEWINFAVNLFYYDEQIREYVNTLLKFNYDMMKKYVIHLDGYKEGGRFLLKFALQGDFNAVFLKVMSFLQMSYAPWYLFSYIYPQPWYWLIPGALQSYWFNGQVITSHTLIYWIVIVHTNTMQFWLTEIHNKNNSDYTSDELRTRETSMEIFRSLNVLNTLFNDSVAPLFIPIIKLHASAINTVCGYIMIRNMNHYFVDEFPASLIYLIGMMVSVIESFGMLNMSSQMFDLGCGYLWSWSVVRDKDFRKSLMSLSAPKIYVRKFYFITTSTTIKFFKVLWDNITNTLLTFK